MPAPEQGANFTGLTSAKAVEALARQFASAGLDTPALDARLLVAAAIGGTTAGLLRDPDRPLSKSEAATVASHARRRLAREPLSRIQGAREFFGRMFHVSPATLDPRPCSETLIEAALDLAEEEGWRTRPSRILDVGTGSGCLLLTLLAELPLAQGLGTDVSREALGTARKNARHLGMAARARFATRSYLDGMAETFDLLVSNPPYIPSGEIAGLEPEVRDYDPRAALDGGPDGLDAYRALARGLARVVPRGVVLVEVGAGQAESVAGILAGGVRTAGGAGSTRCTRYWKDLGGHVRCVALRSQSQP